MLLRGELQLLLIKAEGNQRIFNEMLESRPNDHRKMGWDAHARVDHFINSLQAEWDVSFTHLQKLVDIHPTLDDAQLIPALQHFLLKRYALIHDSPGDYAKLPQYPMNQLCIALSRKLSERTGLSIEKMLTPQSEGDTEVIYSDVYSNHRMVQPPHFEDSPDNIRERLQTYQAHLDDDTPPQPTDKLTAHQLAYWQTILPKEIFAQLLQSQDLDSLKKIRTSATLSANPTLLTTLIALSSTPGFEALHDLYFPVAGDNGFTSEPRLLSWAAMRGWDGVLKALYLANPDNFRAHINKPNADGYTPFMLSIMRAELCVMQFLLDTGIDPSLLTTDQETILHMAAAHADPAVLHILLDHPSLHSFIPQYLNKTGLKGHTALDYALQNEYGNKKSHGARIAALLKGGATPPKELDLLYAVRQGWTEVVNIMLDPGYTGSTVDFTATSDRGDTVLHIAANAVNPELLAVLLNKGGNTHINTPTVQGKELPIRSWGSTPLHYATGIHFYVVDLDNEDELHAKQVQVVHTLIANGAHINALDAQGYSPLARAVDENNFHLIPTLLEAGADPQLKVPFSSSNISLLRLALEKNSPWMAAALFCTVNDPEARREALEKHYLFYNSDDGAQIVARLVTQKISQQKNDDGSCPQLEDCPELYMIERTLGGFENLCKTAATEESSHAGLRLYAACLYSQINYLAEKYWTSSSDKEKAEVLKNALAMNDAPQIIHALKMPGPEPHETMLAKIFHLFKHMGWGDVPEKVKAYAEKGIFPLVHG